jgi:hypothetical protein
VGAKHSPENAFRRPSSRDHRPDRLVAQPGITPVSTARREARQKVLAEASIRFVIVNHLRRTARLQCSTCSGWRDSNGRCSSRCRSGSCPSGYRTRIVWSIRLRAEDRGGEPESLHDAVDAE